jgi:hypothetical protein
MTEVVEIRLTLQQLSMLINAVEEKATDLQMKMWFLPDEAFVEAKKNIALAEYETLMDIIKNIKPIEENLLVKE